MLAVFMIAASASRQAFFVELEFQQTGAYVYRLYRAAYGNTQPFPNPYPDPKVKCC